MIKIEFKKEVIEEVEVNGEIDFVEKVEKKIYAAPNPKMVVYRRYLELEVKGVSRMETPDDTDEMAMLICTAFNNQFDINELYEHIDVSEFVGIIQKIVEASAGESVKNQAKEDHPANKGK